MLTERTMDIERNKIETFETAPELHLVHNLRVARIFGSHRFNAITQQWFHWDDKFSIATPNSHIPTLNA